ncbi:hypothetical protein [Nocardia panacis]|nr:hypothetical protein [Nocardia panacis]
MGSPATTPILDADALDEQIRLYRDAARIGVAETSARSTKVM